MSESLYDFCQQYDQQYLLEEWDDEKNLPLTPDGVTHGSHTVAWWRCGRDHSWQAAAVRYAPEGWWFREKMIWPVCTRN